MTFTCSQSEVRVSLDDRGFPVNVRNELKAQSSVGRPEGHQASRRVCLLTQPINTRRVGLAETPPDGVKSSVMDCTSFVVSVSLLNHSN